MSPLSVHIKHAGKVYDLQLDPDLPPSVFKDAIYHATGVPPDRMKVMVKGGVLKDDTNWKKVGPKEGQTFMVIGAAGELPQPPPKPIVFLEDLDDSDLAEALARPVGLVNLGNTCYMNATVQALRALPELQVALNVPALHSTTPLPAALRDLYRNMSRTTDSITPRQFLDILREVNPQFAETDRSENPMNAMRVLIGRGYAQQDAEECFAAIINTLRNVPGLNASGSSLASGGQAKIGDKKFVDQFLMGEMRRELKCDESPEEPTTVTTEQILKIECNISKTTMFMLTGIMDSLDTQVEKHSSTLGRNAIYTQKSRLTRMPGYLVVHMVRFAWKADIGKKAKIVRRVRFPLDFDALDLATDELKAKLLPASTKIKEVEKERAERRKVRKRTKTAGTSSSTTAPGGSGDVEMSDATTATAAATAAASNSEDSTTKEDKGKAPVLEGDLEDEGTYRTKEAAEFEALVDQDLKKDLGCSTTGLYELVAIVTHKGAAADSGHYIGFVKRSVFHAAKAKAKGALNRNPIHDEYPGAEVVRVLGNAPFDPAIVPPDQLARMVGDFVRENERMEQEHSDNPQPTITIPAPAPAPVSAGPSTSSASIIDDKAFELEEDEDWYKFDDAKVTDFPKEKLPTLEGGGEDSSAYVLVYRSKTL